MDVTFSSTYFSSVQAFQRYFQENDRLLVPANQPFIVKDISIITTRDQNFFDNLEEIPEKDVQLAIYVLNKMASPIAKTISLQFAAMSGNLRYDIKENLELSSSVTFCVQAQKGKILTRLTDLFRLMIASSIPKMTLAPNQELTILGISKKEWQLEPSIEANINKIWPLRVPAGLKFSLTAHSTTDGNNCIMSNRWWATEHGAPQRCSTIRALYGMDLCLYEDPTFLFSDWMTDTEPDS